MNLVLFGWLTTQPYFKELNKTVVPETGDFVFFDALEMHAVTMVRHLRYTVTMWFTEDPQYKHEVI